MPYYSRPQYCTLADAKKGEVGVWMRETIGAGRFAIVNPDIDGLLTFCILKNHDPSLKFGGFYLNEYRMLLTSEANDVRQAEQSHRDKTKRFLSVENDLTIMDSIGQHFCILDNPKFAKINPNALRYGSVRQTSARRLLKDHFGRKYPFSTSFFVWSIFRSDEALTDHQLVALLYPDSAIVKKFITTYRSNAESWLIWLGQSSVKDRFFELAGSEGVRQIARCFFKRIGVTQPAATFNMSAAGTWVSNGPIVQRSLDYFCDLLGIPSQPIHTGLLLSGREYFYTRIKAARQPELRERMKIFFRWLDKSLDGRWSVTNTEPHNDPLRRVVSEAMVTYGEWSVTTDRPWNPVVEFGIEAGHEVVEGRNREHDSHIAHLGLENTCVPSAFGCVWLKCVTTTPGP